jgi:DNA-binding transcriptional regulator YdaS (Cro superfamily)
MAIFRHVVHTSLTFKSTESILLGMEKHIIFTIVDEVGSFAELARRLGLSRSQVHQWATTESIPIKYCPEIEEIVNGKVRCEQMRPDVKWSVLRKRRSV